MVGDAMMGTKNATLKAEIMNLQNTGNRGSGFSIACANVGCTMLRLSSSMAFSEQHNCSGFRRHTHNSEGVCESRIQRDYREMFIQAKINP